SSFAQVLNRIGDKAPDVKNAANFKTTFNVLQELIKGGKIQAGHDIGSGGLITTLLEMCFADRELGADIDLTSLGEQDIIKLLFAENIGVVFQASADVEETLSAKDIRFHKIGAVNNTAKLNLTSLGAVELNLSVDDLRDVWFKTSYLLDQKQSGQVKAKERFENYKNQQLRYSFPSHFDGKRPVLEEGKPRIKAAIIREKGSNSEREMANAMYLAGFDV